MIEMARCLLKEKELPLYFWGEAIRHAIYLLNRLPTRAVEGVTPYEAWSSTKPIIDHLRVFGCLAHMRVPNAGLKKLDNRSKKVIYLGKEPGSKAHRVFDPKTKSVCVTRDLVFEEEKSWDWSQEAVTQARDSNNFLVLTTDLFSENGATDGTAESASTGDQNTLENNSISSGSSNSLSELSASSAETESHPRQVGLLSDVYNDTEPIELAEEELMVMGIGEPVNYKASSKRRKMEKSNETGNRSS